MNNQAISKPAIGLALGGGAARGWAHIGIIKSLSDYGIHPEIVTGCSIGAIVGAAYAAGNLEKLENWLYSLTTPKLARFFELNLTLKGFVDADKLSQFLHENVCDRELNIEDLEKSFACVATDLDTGREIWFTEGNAHEGIWSSIALPGLFPPVKQRGRWLVDGGLVNPVPVSLCRALGADIVIAVSLNSDLVGRRFSERGKESSSDNNFLNSIKETLKTYSGSLLKFSSENQETPPGLIDTIVGSMNIVEDRLTRSRMAGDPPDILLTPKLAYLGLLEFQRAREAIQEGHESVTRKLPEINFLLG